MQKRPFVEFIIHQNEQKTELFMNKPVYLRLLILEISKLVMHIRKIKNGEIMLHGYRQLYSLHKNGKYILRHCKRC